MKQFILFLLSGFLFVIPSLANEKDIYLPSVLTIKDRGQIKIFYDDHRHIQSISNNISWISSYTDSTNITIYYDQKGRIRQKYKYLEKREENSNNILLTTGLTIDYDYTQKDTISVYSFSSTKYGESDSYVLGIRYAKVYTDQHKNVVVERFDKDKTETLVEKTKFNSDGTVSDYCQYSKYKHGYINTEYSMDEFTDHKSIFENVDFVNNYNRTQLMDIFVIIFDRVSKVHTVDEQSVDGDTWTTTKEILNIQYEYNKEGYPIHMEMRSNKQDDYSIDIEYIKF